MSDRRRDVEATVRRASEEEGHLRRLFDRAGPRPPVPADDLAAIKQAFREAWRTEVAPAPTPAPRRAVPGRAVPRRTVARPRILALAASLLIGLGLVWWWLGGARPALEASVVASVERVEGQATVRAAGAELAWSEASVGVRHALALGAEISTEATAGATGGRIAFRLADGPSLRLDTGSRIRLVSDQILHLVRGAVYVDTGAAAPGHGGIEIRTTLGVARDIGTQFEVRLLDSGSTALMRVRVRRGEVRVERGAGRHAVAAEEELILEADGTVEHGTIDVYGPAWAWALGTAPPFDAAGKSLAEILDWIVSETGWTVRWVDAEARAAATAVFEGQIDHLDPEQACAVVLTSAGLSSELVDGVLVIRAIGGARSDSG